MENVDIGQTQFGHRHCGAANPTQFGHRHSAGANPAAQEGHRHCGAAEIARWRRDLRRVAERRARRAWGGCPKGGWLYAALEMVGMLVAAALFGGLFWLYLMATPDQAGAEAEIGRSQIGHHHCRAADRGIAK